MRRWDVLVERHLDRCRGRGLSEATIEQRARELDRWGSWLKHRRPRPKLEEVDAELVIRYLRGRTAFRAKATLASIMSHMRPMGELLVEEGIWSSNPLRWLRGPKLDPRANVPRRIHRPAMRRLWEAAATRRHGYHRYLWLAVLGVLYGTGLRRGELVRLNVSDLDRDSATLRIDGRKTRRQRQAALPPLAWRCLEAYLPKRQNHLEGLGCIEERALFVNRFGGRLSGHAVSQGVQSLARCSGIGRITLHQFRHSCASDLLEDGVRLPEVQRVLGHLTISTTVRYLHVADPQRHAAVAKHPINRFLASGAVA